VRGDSVELACVGPGYAGTQTAQDAEDHHMRLATVRFRRLARDYGRLAETLAGLHFVAFAFLMLKRFAELIL
jgi:hypothetical protein